MFGRHLELKFVKNKPEVTTDEDQKIDKLVDINLIVEESVKKVAVGIIAIMAAGFVFGTAQHLIVNATTKTHNE